MRYRRRFVAIAAAFAVLSCSEGTSPTAASRLDLLSGDGQPGFSGAPLEEPLAVKVFDVNDNVVAGASVSWSVTVGGGSVAPAQTTTDANGVAQTTWTLGLTAGMQEVVASISGVGSVTFSATASEIQPSCDGNPFELEPGGSILLVGSQANLFCVAHGTSSRDYLVVAFNSNRGQSGTASITLNATGVVPVAGPPLPDQAPEQLSLQRSDFRDGALDARLRGLERDELGPRVNNGQAASAALAPSAAPLFSLANPFIGETFSLNTNANSSCDAPQLRTGRVVAVSQRAIVLEDVSNPSGGFTQSEYSGIAATFDTLVYPVDVEHFGEPADIDGNNKIVLFYTSAVNALTPPGAPNGYVAGFFFARDLFPKSGSSRLRACTGSNEAEMFYLMVPDPNGTINGNRRDKDFVRDRTISTMAHELVHLINSSRRLYVNTTARYPERGWVEEGLAHSAEELAFYRASGRTPASNLSANSLRTSARVSDAFNEFQIENILRFLQHLDDTNINSAFQNNLDLATRGAAQWFFRYIVDRKGGDQKATWFALVNGPDTGFRNIEAVIQADAMQWMRDWAVSHYVDDAVNDVSSRYRMLSWNLRSIVSELDPPVLYPVRPPAQVSGVARTRTLGPGGSEYFRFGVGAGGDGRVNLTVSGGAPPPNISVIVVRTR